MKIEGTRPPPLTGIRVLDLSRLLPGPLCGQHLADLGAEVIKIEDKGPGDYARPALRRLVNRGKKGLTLNLKSEEGKEVFLRLVEHSHVLIESFRPGVMERLGIGYGVLSAKCPSLIHCAITGYGQTGSRSLSAGHDLNYTSLVGVIDQTGRTITAPEIPGFLIADILGGTLTAAMGILAALFDARKTGHGRYIDVSMTDAVLIHSVLPLSDFNEHGTVSSRGQGSHTGGAPRYRLYAARDGKYLAVAAQERKFWDAMCDAIGASDLKASHGLSGSAAAHVHQRLQNIFATRDAAEWIKTLSPLDCCVTLVRNYDEAFTDAEFARRGSIVASDVEKQVAFGFPLKMTDFVCDTVRPAPTRGEHTEEILGSLGYSAAEIHELRVRGSV